MAVSITKREIPLPDSLLIGEQVTLIPDALKAWRKERGWSQRELARRAGCSEGLISTIESGYRQASLMVAIRIAEALGVGVKALGLVHVDLDALTEMPEAS
jgi:transcriptional regulator with XRE-family HTH domain